MAYHEAPTTKFGLFWDVYNWNVSNIKMYDAFRSLLLLPGGLNFCATILCIKQKMFIFSRCTNDIITTFWYSLWFRTWKNPLRVSFPGSSLLCPTIPDLRTVGPTTWADEVNNEATAEEMRRANQINNHLLSWWLCHHHYGLSAPCINLIEYPPVSTIPTKQISTRIRIITHTYPQAWIQDLL